LIATNDPNLGLIVACVIPFMVIVIAVLLIVATPLFKKIQTQIDKVTAVLRESLKGVRVIRAFNQEKRETERFKKTDGDLMRISTKSMRVMSFGNPLISIAFDATYIAIYFYGFSRINNGAPSSQAIDFANIVVSAEYAMQLMQSFMMFMFLLILVPRGSACANASTKCFRSQESDRRPQESQNLKRQYRPRRIQRRHLLLPWRSFSFLIPYLLHRSAWQNDRHHRFDWLWQIDRHFAHSAFL
jgi:ATP-binding cassette subfamily B multidrug efflux pump